MAGNKFMGIEEVCCEDDTYIFKSDFKFSASVMENVEDPMIVYHSFCAGECDPNIVKGVLVCAIETKNGEAINNADSEVEELITRNGIQDSWMLARHLLAYAMIGDVKKLQLRRLKPNKLTQLITEPFLLESSKNRQLLWAYHLMISGISVCFSFSLFALLLI